MDSNRLVWYPDSQNGYSIGRIVDITQAKVSIQPVAVPSQTSVRYTILPDDNYQQQQQQQLEFPYKSVYPCDHIDLNQLKVFSDDNNKHNQNIVDVDDNCALIHLNEAALLENIRVRFQRDKIYTYVAHILIAVNPYFEIKDLHSPEAILKYQGKSLGTMAPHVYAIADKAYRDMKAFKQSQSIIINGESGAGKTESQKYVLRYLCLSGSQSGRLEKLILDANPLLEAFGNAKTIRNNNSSRFGKFIEIHYSNNLTVSGGSFFHYLLEKSRICTQSQGERNYHIFYQLCSSLPEKQWKQLELNAPDYFHYLNGGCTQYFCSKEIDLKKLEPFRKSREHLRFGSIQDQLIDDLKCYQQTDEALTNFGVSMEEKFKIYSIVAAVLHLGNISFVDDPDDNRGGCKIDDTDNGGAQRALEITARLMGLDKDLLKQSLISRIMSTTRGGHKGTVYMVQLTVQQAQSARDALAKAIYSKLFDFIVTKIVNKSIPSNEPASYYIGVLDVAGFEYFQHNSYEQFLINFCNEKLQQFFNERILKEEQNIYDKEGLALKKVDFVDNQDCIQLFETKSIGIFDLLDEESRLPKPSAQHFTQSVHSQNKNHFRLSVPRMSKLKSHREIRDDEGFLIRHFAGAVCYETSSFIDKNNDALHASLKNLMLDASNDMLRDLFNMNESTTTTTTTIPTNIHIQTNQFGVSSTTQTSNKLSFISVGTTFRSQLNDLMGKLKSTGSHFIRCIKPNSEMVAHKFEGGPILSQLHCSGMDSVLELMQQGYPSRSSFNDLYQSYKRFLPADLVRLDSHLFCRALFKVVGLNDTDFRFGSSKVFFRPGKFAEFDQIIRSDSEHIASLIKKVSKWLICARWRKAQYCCLSVIKLQRKIEFRKESIINIQKNWRMAIINNRIKFRLNAIKSARSVERTLKEFSLIATKELKKSQELLEVLEKQTQLLLEELNQFIDRNKLEIQEEILNLNNKLVNKIDTPRSSLERSRNDCQHELDKLTTKRDLLIRSIKDKIARQKEELIQLERQMVAENKRREQEELAKKREEEIKLQRNELELRRQQELQKQQQVAQQQQQNITIRKQKFVETGTNPISLSNVNTEDDQEQRDYEIALRLAQESMKDHMGQNKTQLTNTTECQVISARQPMAPSQNYANSSANIINSKFDLTKWKYSDLRDTINTSCDLELLEACKREFHRRLKVYHAWRMMNSRNHHQQQNNYNLDQFGSSQRAPMSVMEQQTSGSGSGSNSLGSDNSLSGNDQFKLSNKQAFPKVNEQRYFRIPFVKGQNTTTTTNNNNNSAQRGWWFAHFDGQWIARQLEIHPDKKPILLIAGKDDIEMCELSLKETRLTSKRGAEILPQEFEEEWQKHGGMPYKTTITNNNLTNVNDNNNDNKSQQQTNKYSMKSY